MKVAISLSEVMGTDHPDYKKHDAEMLELKKALFKSILDANNSPIYGGSLYKDDFMGFIKEAVSGRGFMFPKVISKSFWPISMLADRDKQMKYKDYIDFRPVEIHGNLKPFIKKGQSTLDFINSKTPEAMFVKAMQLTNMRMEIVSEADAFIFVGGKLTNYMGFYPGVLEEMYLACDTTKPIYLIGGYGGVVEEVIKSLQSTDIPEVITDEYQRKISPEYDAFYKYVNEYQSWYAINYEIIINHIRNYFNMAHSYKSRNSVGCKFHNGLLASENIELYNCTDVNRIIELIKKGLQNYIGTR